MQREEKDVPAGSTADRMAGWMTAVLRDISAEIPKREAWRRILLVVGVLAVVAPLVRSGWAAYYDADYTDCTAQLLVAAVGLNYALAFWSMRSQIVGKFASRATLFCTGCEASAGT